MKKIETISINAALSSFTTDAEITKGCAAMKSYEVEIEKMKAALKEEAVTLIAAIEKHDMIQQIAPELSEEGKKTLAEELSKFTGLPDSVIYKNLFKSS
jgi:uncharacterized protein YbcI